MSDAKECSSAYNSDVEENYRIYQMRAVHKEAINLFARKNVDYGDSFAEHGPIGVIIRMGDKLSRITRLSRNGNIQLVKDESMRDTLLDLHNYSAMALMLIDEQDEEYSDYDPE
jgi:hypothetical protein